MITLPDPRIQLLSQPTPLQRIVRTERKLGRSGLFVKRDDQIPIALGGNKLRSLEFWLGQAQAEGADVVLVAGGPSSNMCRLTAAAAAMVGLDCIVFHNSRPTSQNRNDSFLNLLFGASVRYLGEMDEAHRATAIDREAARLRGAGRKPYVAGNSVIGALGYVRAAAELCKQVNDAGANIRHVFLPGSMGPTEAGFIFGNAVLGYPFEVHLVSVEYGQIELSARIDRILDGLSAHTGLVPGGIDPRHVRFHMGYLGAGYDKPTAECEAAILAFARTEGILLEHTYTGKTFAAFVDLAANGGFAADEGICAVHTGGVPALFGQLDRFATLRRDAA